MSIILLAAPSGAGKTTFMRDTGKYLRSLPDELSGLHEMPKCNLVSLSKKRLKNTSEEFLVHFDLTNVIQRLLKDATAGGVLFEKREDILKCLDKALYENWRDLEIIKRQEDVRVVTYFVRREIHFNRWCYRGLKKNPLGGFNKLNTAIVGGVENRSELHRKVYQVWLEAIPSLSPLSSHVLDAN